jgi:hypothetical protein
MNDDRKRDLEAFAKRLAIGNESSRDFISPEQQLGRQALQARDLSEEALAHLVLKNTGVPIPDMKRSYGGETAEFLNRLMQERYPELDPNVSILSQNEMAKKGLGNFQGVYAVGEKSRKPHIMIKDVARNEDGLRKAVSTMLHEAGHQYDDKVLNYKIPDNIAKVNEGQLDIAGMYEAAKKAPGDIDPTELGELLQKSHHANIPNLREGSFGLGALKSYLKNGKFKSIVGPVAGLGLTAAMMPDDASAADFIPGLDQAENAGNAMDDKMIQTEVKAKQNYDNSQARRDALARLRDGR